MIYAAVLAGGKGTRMKTIDLPKQFYEINEKPIIIYTIENILKEKQIDKIYVAVIESYYDFMIKMCDKYFKGNNKIKVIVGGNERMDTIDNVTNAIINDNKVSDDDIIIVHDAVRPFISTKILSDSIKYTKKYGATVAKISAIDTILYSKSGEVVEDVPLRKNLYLGQAPDSFKLKKLIEYKNNLTDEQRKTITGTSQIWTLNNGKIHMIDGSPYNFKITNDIDLALAETIINKEKFYENN